MSHTPSPLYDFFRGVIRSFPAVDRALMHLVRNRRLRCAERLMQDGNFFPESRAEILADYAYATARSHRGLMQVLNLESVIRYVETRNIDGAFVETGTYTGGASAYMLRAVQRLRPVSSPPRAYWGFDSFEGMPTPSRHDGDHASIWVTGREMHQLKPSELGTLVGHEINRTDYDQCLSYLRQTGYPVQQINLVKGWFQETLRPNREKIGPISILRLDGDFYESTKVVFEELFDQVSEGGVIIIDDYGSFQGCKAATDEFLAVRAKNVHLIYVENGIRYFVKPGRE